IVAVLNKNNLKNVKDSQIQEVSDLFVKNFSKNNKINKLSDILLLNKSLLMEQVHSVKVLITFGMIMNVSMLLGGLLIVFSPKQV
ncbi:hypothetical protein ACTPEU_00200, partial [Clostridioides difficile]